VANGPNIFQMLVSKAYVVNEVKMNECYAELEICCSDVLSESRYPACRFLTYKVK